MGSLGSPKIFCRSGPGGKIDEVGSSLGTSAAHSAPIYVTMEGDIPLSETRRAKDVARRWLTRLEDLEARLDEEKITHLANRLARVPMDVVQEDVLQRNRLALVEEIRTAKQYFGRLLD